MESNESSESVNASEDSGFEALSDNEIFISKVSYKKALIPSARVKQTLQGVEPSFPPCKPLAASGHSLEADMLFG